MKMKLLMLISLVQWMSFASAQDEPQLSDANADRLIGRNNLRGWQVPDTGNWSVIGRRIIGDTRGVALTEPEWIYTEEEYEDFVFSVSVKLSGNANSGIYFRANIIDFTFRGGGGYPAPSGYEYDTALNSALNGSIGDFFGRGAQFRFRADQTLVNSVFIPGDWNKMTVRAEGNRIEYWMNGTKINELIDTDTNRNTKGFIGIQLHDKLVMQVEMRNAFVQRLNESGSPVVSITKSNATSFALDGQIGGSNGQNVSLSTVNASDVGQQWEEIDRGGGYYSYQKLGTNFSLDGGASGANNQNVYVWKTGANNYNQQWQKVSTGGGAYKLIKRNASGFAINGGGAGVDGQNVSLWSSSSSSGNLQWFVR